MIGPLSGYIIVSVTIGNQQVEEQGFAKAKAEDLTCVFRPQRCYV